MHCIGKTILLICAVVIAQNSKLVAQNFVQWGPAYKVKGNGEIYKFLGILDDSYYFVMKPNDDNIVQRYSFDHELISEEKFDYIKNRSSLKIHGGIETHSGSFFYMHQYSRKYKEWILHVSSVKNGKISEPREAYFQEIDIENSRLKKLLRNYEYDFGPVDGGLIMSEDSSKVAFVNVIPGNDHRDDDIIAIGVFDNEMQLIWKDLIVYRFGERHYEIEQQVVTNDGDIYLVARVDKTERYEGDDNSVKGKNLPKFDYILYHIDQQGIVNSKIDLGDGNAPMDVALFFPDRSTDQFLMAGFYTDDEHRNRLKGIFFSYGDDNFYKTKIKMHVFPESLLIGLVSDKAIQKKKGLESTYKIKDILNYKDGTIGFIAENNYVRDFSQTDIYGRWYERVVYISDGIIIPKFDSEGNLINIQKIAKDFSSEFLNYTSYSMAINNGRTFLIFNDYKSGRERRELDKKGNRFTDLVVLDQWGQIISQETLFSDREIEFEFTPSLSDYNDDIFLIGSKRGGRFSMSTLKFY